MGFDINRSFVPRVAVERTIQKGIELHEAVHGPVTPEIRAKITNFVVRQANILNRQRQIKGNEGSEKLLYHGGDE